MSANVLVLSTKAAELNNRRRAASGKGKKVRNISAKNKKNNVKNIPLNCAVPNVERIFIVLKFVVLFSALAK